MVIFAIVLLISCVLAFFVQMIANNKIDIGFFALAVFFTLYLMGIGR
jgi:hypothetical protein